MTEQKLDPHKGYAGVKSHKGFVKGDPRICRTGRPKKDKCVPDVLRKLLGATFPPELAKKVNTPWVGEGATFLEVILRRVIILAVQGDMQAVEWIANRVDGRVGEFALSSAEGATEIVEEIVTVAQRRTVREA